MLAGPASGVACEFAQVALLAAQRAAGHENAAERTATRWALAGGVGDLAAPLVLIAVGAGWRDAYYVAALGTVALALAALRSPARDIAAPEDDDGADTAKLTWRDVVRAKPVLAATFAATMCNLLDEIVLAMTALDLDERFQLAASERALVLGAWTVASLAGVVVAVRAVERVSTPTLLVVSGAGCGVALAVAVVTSSLPLAIAGLVVASFFASWHWPLCEALALRAAGARPLLAGAADSLWGPLDLALPFAIAAIAGAFGARAALAVLLVQPVVVVVAGVVAARSARSARQAQQ